MTVHSITNAYAVPAERGMAYVTATAPVTAALAGGVAGTAGTVFAAGAALAAGATFTTAWLDAAPRLIDRMPGGDLIRFYAAPGMMAAATATVAAIEPALTITGFIDTASVPGILSLAWWGTVGTVAYRLRHALRRPRRHTPRTVTAPATTAGKSLKSGVAALWDQVVSGPDGIHPGHDLTVQHMDGNGWSGVVTAPAGRRSMVDAHVVSSTYGVPLDRVTVTPGGHAGELHVAVTAHATAPVATSGLAGLWAQHVARKNGVMAGTHLENVQPDPFTGGEAAYVVADADTDALPTPELRQLAGALRTSVGLISYEADGADPRTAVIRLMKSNPLRTPVPATPDMLRLDGDGHFRIGTGISGRPLRAQLLDPKLGARHLLVSGVTGSGKGGVFQLVCLATHLSGGQIIYADPKGSSNPDVPGMAAYSGLGAEGAMNALRVAYSVLEHRKTLGVKNFRPTATVPHVLVALDEAPVVLGSGSPHAAEATLMVGAIAKEGRSLGVSLLLATQVLQLDEIGGKASIRDNIVGSGGLVLLRADSSQRNLIDLPPGCEGVNPADIPKTWGAGRDPLIHDDTRPMNAPQATYGLGYFLTTDAVPMMGRTLDLESAAPYVDPSRVASLDVLLPGGTDAPAVDAATIAEPSWTPGTLAAHMPEPTAREKILRVLRDMADPMGMEPVFMARKDILVATNLTASTADAVLAELVREGVAVKGDRGAYALKPSADDES